MMTSSRDECVLQEALRESVKETFNYEVSRSDSERINDFMDWAPHLQHDIAYTRSVLSHPVSKWFCKIWSVPHHISNRI